MKCERARELFSEYLEGSIDYALTATVRGHIDECQDCREKLDSFRQAWSLLDTLPELESPHGLRHDIVMRVVRSEHEKEVKAKQGTFGLTWAYLFGRLVPARAIAIALGGAALAAVLMTLSPATYERLADIGGSKTVPEYSQREHRHNPLEASSLLDYQITNKKYWRDRKVQRNILWISAVPAQISEGQTVYQIMLSINHNALYGEATARIGAQVYLLPERPDGRILMAPESLENAKPIWKGDVLAGQETMLPWSVVYGSRKSGTDILLVTWKFRHRQFAQVIYIPTRKVADSSTNALDLTPGAGSRRSSSDLYSTLQAISSEYGATIIANAQIDKEVSGVDLGWEGLEDALRTSLLPIDVTWRNFDGAVYVDRKARQGVEEE